MYIQAYSLYLVFFNRLFDCHSKVPPVKTFRSCRVLFDLFLPFLNMTGHGEPERNAIGDPMDAAYGQQRSNSHLPRVTRGAQACDHRHELTAQSAL